MLKLRRGIVVEAEPLTIEVDGERRRAWADAALVGEVQLGDEVVVNTEALDLGLGSGGFDVVHANLTRGLAAPGSAGEHVMKLNYTSLQHPVRPLEGQSGPTTEEAPPAEPATGRAAPVLVIQLHGQLAPALWAARQVNPQLRVGYVQTPGGALPGSFSRDVARFRECGWLTAHVTAGPSHGGEHEAISVAGGIDGAARALECDAIVAGPGPGILGSASRLGHGGMAALDTAHAALALGLPTLLAPRLSSADPRPRHRGLSHHTRVVLEMLLAPVRVPVPETETVGWPLLDAEAPEGGSQREALEELIAVTKGRHDLLVRTIDLDGYAASGLPARTMGRTIAEDPLFFAAALAAGGALADAAAA